MSETEATPRLTSRERRRDTAELNTRSARALALARTVVGLLVAVALCLLGPTRRLLATVDPAVPSVLFLLGCTAFVLGRWPGRRALRGTDRRLRRLLDAWGLPLAVLAFLMPLCAAWELDPGSGNTAFAALWGRIPWGDAHGHFEGAQRLLAEGAFPPFSGRRPLNACWLAVRLALTGGSLLAALAVQAVLLGAAAFAAARALGRNRGVGAALAFFGLLLGLTSDYLPSAATEPLGVTLACAAFAVLWPKHARGRVVPALGGLWLLDLALQARPGAQFLLPCLGLWVVWTCRGRRLQAAAGAALVAVAGVALSASLNALYGTSDASASAAGAYPLYGLATGSNYRQIQEDLGLELARLPDDRARTRLIYERAWQRLRADPGVAVRALGRNLRKFAGKAPPVLYGIVSPQALFVPAWERAEPTPAVRARDRWLGRALLALAMVALVLYLWRAPADVRLFWLAVAAGIVLSAPVVYGDAGLRGLAASFPFLCALLAVGLGRSAARGDRALPDGARQVLLASAAALVVLALVGPAVAHAVARRPLVPLFPLPPDVRIVRVRPAPAVVVSSRERPELDVTVLPRRQYLRHVGLANVAASGFDRPDPPFAVVSAYDYVEKRQRVLVLPPEALGATPFLRVVVHPIAEDPNLLLVTDWRPTE
jgi:hypothetical protein